MADPREIALQAGLVTPRRTVSVEFDLPQSVLKEPFFQSYREGRQILPQFVSGCIRLRSGVWQLAPINDWGINHESELAQSFVVRLADWDAHPVLVEVPHQRNPAELTGLNASPDVAVAGDYFLTKRVTAGETWDNELVGADVPPDILSENHYPLQFVARTEALHTGMTGYMLKCYLPGGPLQTRDVCIGFAFGGAIRAEGYGRFFLALKGDGNATLFEKIGGFWVEQARWRYMSPAELPGGAFALWILPFWPDGIEFDTYSGGGADDYFSLLGERSLDILSGVNATQGAHQSYVFSTGRGELAQADGAGHLHAITGNGFAQLYIRQDLRPLVQVARLGYDGAGVITDQAIALPHYSASEEHVLRVAVHGYNWRVPGSDPRTSMSIELFDAETGDPLTEGTEEQTWRGTEITWEGYLPPGGKQAVQAEILLQTEEDEADETWWTPYLTAYTVTRNAHIDTHEPGVKTGGTVIGVSTSGPGYDPELETAAIGIQDLKDELTFLRSRGKTSVRVSTTFDEGGTESTATCVIFDGYTGRVTNHLRGKDAMVYPDPEWRDLEIECEGKWQRLTERFFHARIPFHDSTTSPSRATDTDGDRLVPWKATDVIRHLLLQCGWGEEELEIPDLDIRLFIRADQKPDGVTILMPGTSVASYLAMICRDFVNGFLFWEPNAKSDGAWILRQPPDGTEDPLWTFTLDRPPAGPRLAHQSVSYGDAISPILGPDERFAFSGWVTPPEGNVVTVSGGWDQKTGRRFQTTIVNEESFDAPLHPATADSSNLDYVGHGGVVPVEYVDTSLDSQQACDWIARRVYNLALRGRKFVAFTAELVLVDRQTAEPEVFTTRPRSPLRPGDLVNIQDQEGNDVLHIVHQVSPQFSNQGVMTAEYLCELFRADSTFALVGDLGMPKEVAKRESRRAVGASPWSPRLLSPQSQRSFLDSEILSLPVAPAEPIKTGSTWAFMLGFSSLDGEDELS